MEMKRVIVFLLDSTVRACDALAAQYGSSRSEVILRLEKVRVAEAEAVAVRRSATARKKSGRPVRPADVAVVVPLDAETAIPQLVQYGGIRSTRTSRSRGAGSAADACHSFGGERRAPG